jgi:hypothetical protein
MIWISRSQEIELDVIFLGREDALFEFRAILTNKLRSLVHDHANVGRRENNSHRLCVRFERHGAPAVYIDCARINTL